jgi:23S rRNA pseudouridine1911/1915/1917 synthase
LQLNENSPRKADTIAMRDEQHIELQAQVPVELAGGRLDQSAAVVFDQYSRVLLKNWIETGELLVDGLRVKPRHRLRGGETLTLSATLQAREDWRSAQPIAFDIVFEDEDLLVVNKPAGLVVHPGAGNPDGTLVNGLLNYRPALEVLPRAGIVHRLDKDTSGLLLVAGNLPAQGKLTAALAARTVSRCYQALVEGVLVAGRDIDLPIGRHPQQRTRQAVREDGREALTRIRILERLRTHSYIEARLATGRTHQIRVHMAAIGYPLVGDRRYGARGRVPEAATKAVIEAIQHFQRQALHAWQLGFEHPASGEWLEFSTPAPDDMQHLLALLRNDAAVAEQDP